METPSSSRRVTRSQTLTGMNSCGGNIPFSSKKTEVSVNCQSQSRQRSNSSKQQHSDRSALIDITNDSPIVGVAMKTPSSAFITAKKKQSGIKSTPGSGEALLRGQVKTLLQKVEEEAVLTKITTLTRPFIHLVSSPMGLVAPTPANTPQVPNFEGDESLGSVGVEIAIASPVVVEHLTISEELDEGKEEKSESLKSLSITRSLLLDFSDKSECWDSSDCSSVVSHKGESELTEEDDSSVWSMQVNASSKDEDDEEEYNYDEEEEDVDGLCEGIRKMSVAEFAGKHTRFVYDSEGDEIVDAKEEDPVVRLKGWPTPKGKHSRFGTEEEEESV